MPAGWVRAAISPTQAISRLWRVGAGSRLPLGLTATRASPSGMIPHVPTAAERANPRTITRREISSPQRLVDGGQGRGPRRQVRVAQSVERPRHRAQMIVQVPGLRIDVEKAGDDLAARLVGLQMVHRRMPVGGLVVGGQLAKFQDRAVVLG